MKYLVSQCDEVLGAYCYQHATWRQSGSGGFCRRQPGPGFSVLLVEKDWQLVLTPIALNSDQASEKSESLYLYMENRWFFWQKRLNKTVTLYGFKRRNFSFFAQRWK